MKDDPPEPWANDSDAPAWMIEWAYILGCLPALMLIALYFIDGPQPVDAGGDWFYVE